MELVNGPAPHRQLHIQGYGVFENIGGDLSIIKPQQPKDKNNSYQDVKQLCMKIYRSTNLSYQQIAKLIVRNKSEELRK